MHFISTYYYWAAPCLSAKKNIAHECLHFRLIMKKCLTCLFGKLFFCEHIYFRKWNMLRELFQWIDLFITNNNTMIVLSYLKNETKKSIHKLHYVWTKRYTFILMAIIMARLKVVKICGEISTSFVSAIFSFWIVYLRIRSSNEFNLKFDRRKEKNLLIYL